MKRSTIKTLFSIAKFTSIFTAFFLYIIEKATTEAIFFVLLTMYWDNQLVDYQDD